MRTLTKYNYPVLRQQYVTTPDLSLRELCRRNEIEEAFSTVAARARREDWAGDRRAYESVEKQKVYEAIAERRAHKLAEIEKDTLEVIHAAVLQLGVNLSDREVVGPTGPYVIPAVQVTPSDLVKLIDKIQLLSGKPTEHTREDHLGISFTGNAGDLPAEILRDLAAIARSKGAGQEPVGRTALPGLEGARKVN